MTSWMNIFLSWIWKDRPLGAQLTMSDIPFASASFNMKWILSAKLEPGSSSIGWGTAGVAAADDNMVMKMVLGIRLLCVCVFVCCCCFYKKLWMQFCETCINFWIFLLLEQSAVLFWLVDSILANSEYQKSRNISDFCYILGFRKRNQLRPMSRWPKVWQSSTCNVYPEYSTEFVKVNTEQFSDSSVLSEGILTNSKDIVSMRLHLRGIFSQNNLEFEELNYHV